MSDQIEDFDNLCERLVLSRGFTYEDVLPELAMFRAVFESLLRSDPNWQRLEEALYIHHLYDILDDESVDLAMAYLVAAARGDGLTTRERDWCNLCQIWVHEWRASHADVFELFAGMEDRYLVTRSGFLYLEVLGNAGESEAFERAHRELCEVHSEDRAALAYLGASYLGFATLLGLDTSAFDPWDIELDLSLLPCPHHVFACGFLSSYYIAASAPDHAWRLDQEALRLVERFAHPTQHASILVDSATTDLTLGKTTLAYEKILMARQMLEDQPNTYIYGRSVMEEARVLLRFGHARESIALCDEAIETLSSLGYEHNAMVARFIRAMGMSLDGEHEHAALELEALRDGFPKGSSMRRLVSFLNILFDWSAGDLEHATRLTIAFVEEFDSAANNQWLCAIDWIRESMLDLAALPRPPSREPLLPTMIEWRRAIKRLGGDVTVDVDVDVLGQSVVGLMLCGLLREHDASRRELLVLAMWSDSRSFSIGQDVVSLKRRASLWAILESLTESSPDPVGVDALFAIGWPGEEHVDPQVATRRVYWAVSELRKLGLHEVLVTYSPGYALDARVRIEHHSGE